MTALAPRAPVPANLRHIGVPRAAARVLFACAEAERLCPDLRWSDELARAAAHKLGGCVGRFDEVELRAAALRAFVLDELARDFFVRVPRAFGVGIWPMLGTRAHRLGGVPWIDVDTPELAELRRFMLPARPGWSELATCRCGGAWIELVCRDRQRPALFVSDESVLPVAPAWRTRWLDAVSRRAPSGSELLIAFDAGAPLRACSPLRPGSALEVPLAGAGRAEALARYPRLRFVDSEIHSGKPASGLAGVNALATLHRGVGAPALAHLRVV